MSYIYRPFPKMLHRPGGAQKIVQHADELADALLQGWSLRPVLAAHDPSGWSYPEPAAAPVEPAPDAVTEPEYEVLVPIEPPLVERSPKKARKARE